MTSIANLERLQAKALSEIILSEATGEAAADPTFAIIDVRDDDHIGGHIKGSQNIPSRMIDTMMPTLVRQLKDKKTVVFHCALSQQRGPSAALKYLRERERVLGKERKVEGEEGKEETEEEKRERELRKKEQGQKVFVLDRGFVGWQEVFGTDERLTEGYRKELWVDGYWG